MPECEHPTPPLTKIEECDAWMEYLDATRGQTPFRYAEVEPWAWKRLENRLSALRRRAQKAA